MKTIMLDVDGVLVCGRPQDGAHLFTDLEKDLGITVEALQSAFFAPRWAEIVTGKKPLLPELETALSVIAPDVSAETVVAYWFANDARIDTDVLEATDALRTNGTRVYLATNQEHMRADYLMQKLGLGAHFDGIFYSASIGHRKPNVEFFRHVGAAIGGPASDITLIDDTEPNVAAARAFGWGAIHWRSGMRLGPALETLRQTLAH